MLSSLSHSFCEGKGKQGFLLLWQTPIFFKNEEKSGADQGKYPGVNTRYQAFSRELRLDLIAPEQLLEGRHLEGF